MRRFQDDEPITVEGTLSDSIHRHIDEAMQSTCALLRQLQADRRGPLAERLDAVRQHLMGAKATIASHYAYKSKR